MNRVHTFLLLILVILFQTGMPLQSFAQVQDSSALRKAKPVQNPQPIKGQELKGVIIDTISFDPDVDLSSQLPGIDSLITIALLHNPNVRFEDASIRKANYNLKYTKYLWLNGMTGFFNYTYGNQTNLTTINSDGSVLNNSLGVGWRAGFNFTLPFTEIFGRPARIKQLKAEVDMAKAKKDDQIMDLKRLLIQDYFNLMASQKLLWIRTQDVESAKLTAEIATVEMKRGKIHPQELSRLKNLQALAESNLELTKKDFMTYYYFLENWVGVKLSTLKIKSPGTK